MTKPAHIQALPDNISTEELRDALLRQARGSLPDSAAVQGLIETGMDGRARNWLEWHTFGDREYEDVPGHPMARVDWHSWANAVETGDALSGGEGVIVQILASLAGKYRVHLAEICRVGEHEVRALLRAVASTKKAKITISLEPESGGYIDDPDGLLQADPDHPLLFNAGFNIGETAALLAFSTGSRQLGIPGKSGTIRLSAVPGEIRVSPSGVPCQVWRATGWTPHAELFAELVEDRLHRAQSPTDLGGPDKPSGASGQ